MTTEATPGNVPLSEGLGPTLDAWAEAAGHVWMTRGGEPATGWPVRRADLEQLARAVQAAERERWRGLLEARAAGCERAAENTEDTKFDAMARVLMSAREDGSRA